MPDRSVLALYFRPRLLAMLLLGFASGLPLALTASTLSVWLFEEGVEKSTIGLFGAIAMPYTLKFLWSPLVDGVRVPLLGRWFGRRRGWLLASQAALTAAIVMLGMTHPAQLPWWTALAAFFVSLCSATQDIVADAYRVERLDPIEQGAGAAIFVLGYRLGMIASSAGALLLAQAYGWPLTYVVMAALVGIGMIAALWAGEPPCAEQEAETSLALPPSERAAAWMRAHVVAPFADFMTRPQWLTLLLFVVFYKLADAFIGLLTNPFLLELGFTKAQIAAIAKLYGLVATIVGGLLGGMIVYRIGIVKTLWLGGILNGVTNLLFVYQARMGADPAALALVMTLENLSGGIGTSAFVAFLGSLCNVRFTATQYALLSSLAATARTWLSLPAGWVAQTIGWEAFFAASALLAIPGLVLLARLSRGDKA